jgi:hypothetical protein
MIMKKTNILAVTGGAILFGGIVLTHLEPPTSNSYAETPSLCTQGASIVPKLMADYVMKFPEFGNPLSSAFSKILKEMGRG